VIASGGISWDFMIPLIASPPFLGFYDLVGISKIASPPFLGFYDLVGISKIASPPNASPGIL